MVEGPSFAKLNYGLGNTRHIAHHIAGGNALNSNAEFGNGFVPPNIAVGVGPKIVNLSINLDNQLRRRAVEVGYVGADRILAAELDSGRRSLEKLP